MANTDQPAEETNKPFVMPDDRQPEPIPDAEIVEDRAEAPPEPAADPMPEPEPEPIRDAPPPRDPEPAPASRQGDLGRAAPPPQPTPRRSGAFLGFVAGGIIAAGGGFALARYYPDILPIGDTAAMKAQVDAQTAELAALQGQLAELAPLQTQVAELVARPVPDVTPDLDALRAELDDRIAALALASDPAAAIAEARATIDAGLQALDARLAAVEERPAASGGIQSGAASGVDGGAVQSLRAEIAATAAEVDALRAEMAASTGQDATATAELQALAADAQTRIEAASAEAERLRAEAETSARAALAQAALNRVKAALEAGGPFASAIEDLTAAGTTVPQALVDAAPTGVPTVTDLQRGFLEPARQSLDAALRSNPGEGWADRVTGFLRSQTGARSLEPREGPDPDAVLSRAEAALAAGNVATALTELAALPDSAKAVLAAWVADAERREAAGAALAELSAAIDAE